MKPSRSTLDTHVLLSEVLDEIMEQVARGESPKLDEYAARYPQLEDILRKTMPALQLINESSSASVSVDDLPLRIEPPRQLGDFRLRRQIGRGGMGMVYEAEQQSMGRRVALKILPFASLADSKSLQRFKNEIRAAAALDHPNIVSVYSVGEENGVYFYAMQLIRGQNLSAVIQTLSDSSSDGNELDDHSIEQVVSDSHYSVVNDEARADQAGDLESNLDPAEALETMAKANDSTTSRWRQRSYYKSAAMLGIQAARALQYAHELGIVHRDIKPANLLLDENARLYVTDFGLASIEAHAGATATGDVIGTLRYMPPEQALGKHELIDHRADIYSVGITLYELLTLKPAFQGRDRHELLQQVTLKEPESPRKLQPTIPVELETIVMKAIAKERDERYATAGELSDDLLRFVENQPIRARPVSLLTRARKWTQRNALLVTTSLVLLLLATITTSLILVRANLQERQLRERAEDSLQLARETVDQMYLEIGLEWLSQDRRLSDFQQTILARASKYYQSLVDEMDPQDPVSRADAAWALQRIARIHNHAESYGVAREKLEQSISIWKGLIADGEQSDNYREPLRQDLMNLASIENLLGQYEQAMVRFDELQSLTDELRTSATSNDGQFLANKANLELLMADTAFQQRNLDHSQELLAKAKFAIDKYKSHDPGGQKVFELRARHGLGTMAVMRTQGRLTEAEQLGRKALRNVQWIRTSNDDTRQLLQNELQLTRELAQICVAQGETDEAAELLETSLKMSRTTFSEQLSPAEVMSHAFFTPGFNLNDHLRPMAFCKYVNDQLLLSSILSELNRPHRAELLLAEAERASIILAQMFPASPRYHAAKANTYTELALLLEDDRPGESQLALRQAADAWQQAIKAAPGIQTYESGLRSAASDIRWFRERFPDDAIPDGQRTERSSVRLRTGTHFTGVYLLGAGLPDKAIRRFEASLKQDPQVPAYDWLYLALAHHDLGDAEASNRNFALASEWIAQHDPKDEELAELFDNVAAKVDARADG